MAANVFIPGLGNGVLLVDYADHNEDNSFEAFYSIEAVMNLATDNANYITRILHVTKEGLVAELTIAFEQGRLQLVRKQKPEVNKNEI